MAALMRAFLIYCYAILICSTVPFSPSFGQSPAAQRGLVFVRTHCARCHAIDRVSPSPLQIAPPFRELHQRYPIETLKEAFAEGIRTGHPSMPEFRLDPAQINDVIAYLKSLE